MAYLIQHRRDTKENWEKYNPVLADGEMGFIKDIDGDGNQKSSLYKIGDGRHTWNDLPLFGYNGNVYPDFEGDDLEYSVPTRSLMKTELDGKLNTDQLKQSIKLTEEEEEYVVDTTNHIVSRAALIEGLETIENSIDQLDTELDAQAESIEGINTTINDHTTNLTNHQERLITCESSIDKNTKYLEGYVEKVDEEEILHKGLIQKVQTLEELPQPAVMPKDQFDDLPETALQENTLYFIYEPVQE